VESGCLTVDQTGVILLSGGGLVMKRNMVEISLITAQVVIFILSLVLTFWPQAR
jgi:hypothetical protein